MQSFNHLEEANRTVSSWTSAAMEGYAPYLKEAIRESEIRSGEAYANAMSIRLTD